ncbi:lipoyl synthase [Reinekea marina]|uniref:Lipoyl synthase n=1 Tax=Reinekea marina TaxID=1310421 RepID=A0ABV7WMQ8_9GAMM|nr:lipoyl synthase [Reinekea marina]MBU2864914.1 lipoyl synthase [Reinekea forsetii]MDN3648474.1 lipoyl synthase [Reinekea marina]
MTDTASKPVKPKKQQGVKLRGADKTDRIPIKVIPTETMLKKPDWIRVRIPASPEVANIKKKLRSHNLHSVCEEANCPNLGECFSHGTATFMIMGDICTRRCPFCDVAHGRPNALNEKEPEELAKAIGEMGLKYVVITSVDRDDLRDGGAQHITDCVAAVRKHSPGIRIETLVPDFRGRLDVAVDIMETDAPDVFNHNLETVPSLYKKVRPGADYQHSLDLLKAMKERKPDVKTKSGLMVGVGESIEEVKDVMRDLYAHKVDMVTIGQYLQPSKHHLAVERFVHPDEFKELEDFGMELGFENVASGPLVRSSYHADLQAKGEQVG